MKLRGPLEAAAESTPLLRCLPVRTVPVRSQLIVLPPLVRVAEDFVGLVYFPELAFSRCLVFGDVGVVLACERPERLLDLRLSRVSSHPENGVVVPELNGHRWLRGNGSDHSQ